MSSSSHRNDTVKKKRKGSINPTVLRKRARTTIIKQESSSSSVDEIVQMTLEEKCDLIAELSESILENPTTAFRVEKDNETSSPQQQLLQVSKMRRLLELSNTHKNGNDAYTARLGILSLLAIFQDIIPSYRIRLPTAAEAAVRVTKETKATWDYERALLAHYQQYLKLLERTWDQRNNNNNNAEETLSVSALLCLCELFKCAFHFNFHSNIASLVVRNMNYAPSEEVRVFCCNAVRHVFAQDSQGQVALETTRLVAKVVRNGIKNGYSVRPDVVSTFVALPLRVFVDEAQAAKIAAKANKKRKKALLAEIQDEMQEGSATVDKIVLAQSQADTLEAVVLVYFCVLKSENAQVQSSLLSPTLEGLAKFAHLINIDTVVDVLAVLKKLLQNVDTLPLDGALNCVLTAFQTLQGPGREMKIDQKEYVTPLYSQLPRLCFENRHLDREEQRHVTDLALDCLNVALLKRREYSRVRIASFVKRLCSMALVAPSHTSAPLLAFVRQVFQRYPSVHSLLENELDIVTSGVYDAAVHDPEHANPFATSCWELSLLKFHMHPLVSSQATSMGAASKYNNNNNNNTNVLQTTPTRIRSEMIRNAKELYIECRYHAKKHPLMATSRNKKRPQQQQVRFLKPKHASSSLHLFLKTPTT